MNSLREIDVAIDARKRSAVYFVGKPFLLPCRPLGLMKPTRYLFPATEPAVLEPHCDAMRHRRLQNRLRRGMPDRHLVEVLAHRAVHDCLHDVSTELAGEYLD